MSSSDFDSSDSEAELELLTTLDSLQVEAEHQQQIHQAHMQDELRNNSAKIIQQAWRSYRQAKVCRMTEGISLLHSIRANPFDASRANEQTADSEQPSPEKSSDHHPIASRQSLLLDDEIASLPSPTDEPSFHMAAVAAQLYSLDDRDQHIEEVLTTRNVKENQAKDESFDDSHGNPNIKHLLTSVYSSVQLCYVGGNDRKQPAAESADTEPESSGRESRGAADGASTGSPELEEGLDEELERSATPHCLETSCLDDDLKRDVCARLESPATPVQEMEWIVDDDDESATAVEFGLQMWRRGECSLTASQLHCLNVQQLLALRNELQTLVGRASEELVNLLTLRDTLACQRDEYNVYFESYSRQLETDYRKAAVQGNPGDSVSKKKRPWRSFLSKS